jgi:hypothetical protein
MAQREELLKRKVEREAAARKRLEDKYNLLVRWTLVDRFFLLKIYRNRDKYTKWL